MKCGNCGCDEFRPKIVKATWAKDQTVKRRALGVWSCKACGYGGTAFHSDWTAKTCYVLNQTFRWFRMQQSFATTLRLMRAAWWKEDRTA